MSRVAFPGCSRQALSGSKRPKGRYLVGEHGVLLTSNTEKAVVATRVGRAYFAQLLLIQPQGVNHGPGLLGSASAGNIISEWCEVVQDAAHCD